MPEGFKSVSDMQVVIDANTDKLNGGLTVAHNLVQRFAGEGSTALTKFDSAVAVTGAGLKTMLGPIGAVISALQVVNGLWEKYGPRIDQAASIAGMTDDWKKLKESASGFAETLTGAIPDAYSMAKKATDESTKSASDSFTKLEVAAGTSVPAAFEKARVSAKASLAEVDEDADDTEEAIESVAAAVSKDVPKAFATAAVASEDYFAGVRSRSSATADAISEDAKRAMESWGKKASRVVADSFDEASAFIVRFYKPEDKLALKELENDMKLAASFVNASQEQIARGFASGNMPEWQMTYYVDNYAKELARLQSLRDRYNAMEKPKSEFEQKVYDEIAAIEKKTEMIGTSAVEMAAYAEKQKLLALLAKDHEEATKAESAAIDKAAEAARELVRAQQSDSVTKAITAETDAIAQRRDALGLAGVELELFNARQKLVAMATKDGRELTEQDTASINIAIQSLRNYSIAKSEAAVEKGIADEVKAIVERASALGLSGIELEVHTARQKLMALATKDGREATEAETEAINQAAAAFRSYADDKAAASIDKQLLAEAAAIDVRRHALGLEGPALDAYNERAKLMAMVSKDGRMATEAEIATIDKLVAATRSISNAKALAAQDKKDDADQDREIKSGERIMENLDTELRAIQRKTDALTMGNAEASRAATIEKAMSEFRRAGIEITNEERAAIEAHADAISRQTEEYNRQQSQVKQLQDVVQVGTRGMESAFQKFTSGAKADFSELIRSILSDLAMLTFKQSVTQPLAQFLSGGGTAGGSGLLGSLFGGFRAEGGPVDPSQAYIVGERGPELFMPSAAGNVVPNHALGGGAVTIHMPLTIDARGAYPESISEIKQSVASLHASIPGRALEAVREASQRGL